jgi:hypothetical protein
LSEDDAHHGHEAGDQRQESGDRSRQSARRRVVPTEKLRIHGDEGSGEGSLAEKILQQVRNA